MKHLIFRSFLIILFSIGFISCGSNQGTIINSMDSEYLPDTDSSLGSGSGNRVEEEDRSVVVAPEPCGNALACSMQDKINDIRRGNNRLAFVADEACQRAAQSHAEDMARNDFFDHIGSGGSTPSSRLRRYGGGDAAENIAFGSSHVESVARLWMSSSGHASNILGNYRKTGVGAAFSSKGTYWVQCFTD